MHVLFVEFRREEFRACEYEYRAGIQGEFKKCDIIHDSDGNQGLVIGVWIVKPPETTAPELLNRKLYEAVDDWFASSRCGFMDGCRRFTAEVRSGEVKPPPNATRYVFFYVAPTNMLLCEPYRVFFSYLEIVGPRHLWLASNSQLADLKMVSPHTRSTKLSNMDIALVTEAVEKGVVVSSDNQMLFFFFVGQPSIVRSSTYAKFLLTKESFPNRVVSLLSSEQISAMPLDFRDPSFCQPVDFARNMQERDQESAPGAITCESDDEEFVYRRHEDAQ